MENFIFCDVLCIANKLLPKKMELRKHKYKLIKMKRTNRKLSKIERNLKKEITHINECGIIKPQTITIMGKT